jgi:hypothetical protein
MDEDKITTGLDIFDNPTSWSKHALEQRMSTSGDREGLSDIKLAQRDGYNLKNYRMNLVWKALEILYKEKKDGTFIIDDIYAKIESMFQTGKWERVEIDRTTLCHYVGRLWALGLLGRTRMGKDLTYYFQTIIRAKGLDWFKFGNEYIGKPAVEGGLFDDLLMQKLPLE